MQTMLPPDEVSKERFARIDERLSDVNRRFDEVNRRITESREETKDRFNRVESDVATLKKGLDSVQSTLNRLSFGLALTFASVLGAILTRSF